MCAPRFLTANSNGVFTRQAALSAGHSDRDLRDWVSQGVVRRMYRGVFAVGEPPAYGAEQLVERPRAIACRHPDNLALSHQSALALHGIALHGVPRSTYAVRLGGGARSGPDLHVVRPRAVPPMTHVNGLIVVTPEAAVVQVANTFGLQPGLVAADSALHRRLVTKASLAVEVERAGQTEGISVSRIVLARCRMDAESPGESRLRLIVEDLGYAVELQYPILTRPGQLPFAFADLRLVGHRCLLEFDGAVKYEGVSGKAALMAEKVREDRIRRLGWGLERVVWDDLNNPRQLGLRIAAVAGLG